MPGFDEIPLTEFEHDLLWTLHAAQFYVGQRRWLFGLSTPVDVNEVVATRVHSFVTATPALIAAHLASLKAKRLASG
jgi:hypothetical protein